MKNLLNFDSFITEQNINNLSALIEECTEAGIINEGKFKDLIKQNFHNFEDLSKTVKRIAVAGTIGLAMLIMTIQKSPVGSNEEKESLIQEVTDLTEENDVEDIYVKTFDFSNDLVEYLKSYENFKSTKYFATESERKDNKATIGYGHVIKDSDPDWLKNCIEISENDATKLLKNDIDIHHKEFLLAVRRLPAHLQDPSLYTQGFVDACVSMVFNMGRGNFINSPFFQTWKNCRIDSETGKIRQDDYDYTCSMIKKSGITQKGKTVNGLVNRRSKEYKMTLNSQKGRS